MSPAKQGTLDGTLTPAEKCARHALELREELEQAKTRYESKVEETKELMLEEDLPRIVVNGVSFEIQKSTALKVKGYKKPETMTE